MQVNTTTTDVFPLIGQSHFCTRYRVWFFSSSLAQCSAPCNSTPKRWGGGAETIRCCACQRGSFIAPGSCTTHLTQRKGHLLPLRMFLQFPKRSHPFLQIKIKHLKRLFPRWLIACLSVKRCCKTLSKVWDHQVFRIRLIYFHKSLVLHMCVSCFTMKWHYFAQRGTGPFPYSSMHSECPAPLNLLFFWKLAIDKMSCGFGDVGLLGSKRSENWHWYTFSREKRSKRLHTFFFSLYVRGVYSLKQIDGPSTSRGNNRQPFGTKLRLRGTQGKEKILEWTWTQRCFVLKKKNAGSIELHGYHLPVSNCLRTNEHPKSSSHTLGGAQAVQEKEIPAAVNKNAPPRFCKWAQETSAPIYCRDLLNIPRTPPCTENRSCCWPYGFFTAGAMNRMGLLPPWSKRKTLLKNEIMHYLHPKNPCNLIDVITLEWIYTRAHGP